MELDEVFSLTACAVERVVDIFGAAIPDRGDHEADIEAEAGGFDPGGDPALARSPGFGGRHSGAARPVPVRQVGGSMRSGTTDAG